ncbi:MAG: DUF4364 family protein [Clostridia bacterium]|nr:DUF4364 family protein [Clostridia bacterium]
MQTNIVRCCAKQLCLQKRANGRRSRALRLDCGGRWCLKNFYARIPSSVRQIIADDIKKKRIEYRRRQDYIATYEKCPDGSYDVILKIVEPTKTTLEIKFNVMTRNIAKYIERTWQEKAPTVYGKISDTLID